VLLCSLLTAIGVFAIHNSFQTPAWPVYDYLQRSTALESSSDVALIYITQEALDRAAKDIGYKFPWPREVWGELLDVAKKLDAKSVTFDIGFSSASMYGVADDDSFNTSIKRNQIPVIMPGPDGAKMTEGPNARIAKDLGPLLILGATNNPQESDGIYRRMPVEIRGHRSLAFAREPQPEPASHDIWMKFYRQDGIPWVDVYSLFNVYAGLKSDALTKVENTLRGKHWIIGGAAPGLLDLKPLPTNPRAPGPEIHATALSNLIEHHEIKFFSASDDAVAAFAGALLTFAVLIFSATPIPALAGASLLALIGPFAISALVWLMGYWFNPLPTLTVTGTLALVTLGLRFQVEWRQRQRLAKSVENSMSSEMVDLIRLGKLELTRFGERREISIFFCDLSGFTTISESLDAAILVDVLNLYMQETVDLIFKHRGFVDKFIGDAVMAIWGAPVHDPRNHAVDALATAIEFQTAFARFREKAHALIGESANELSARVGVHTGTAIVGNIGAHTRFNYTAIGDPVNLASRLEGLGKQYDCDLLISEEMLIAARCLGDSRFIEVDLIAVKGKSTPTRLFTYDTAVGPDDRTQYAKALDFYRHARFAEALASFESVASHFPPARKMAERCRSAIQNGRPKFYRDGVWYFDEK
jgi:adenylate cyclase